MRCCVIIRHGGPVIYLALSQETHSEKDMPRFRSAIITPAPIARAWREMEKMLAAGDMVSFRLKTLGIDPP